jgi:hypothetical protein
MPQIVSRELARPALPGPGAEDMTGVSGGGR